jgi:hypothetical protein
MTLHTKTRNIADPSTSPTRIYLTLGRFDRQRGQRFHAHLGAPDGERIVTDALDVEFAACRALKARGVTGRMETWWIGSSAAAVVIQDINEAAELTVREDATHPPSLARYRPWPKMAVPLILGVRQHIAGPTAVAPRGSA